MRGGVNLIQACGGTGAHILMNILDVLLPQTPPEPKGARVERIADGGSDPVNAEGCRQYRVRNRERVNAATRRRYANRKASGASQADGGET